MARCILLRGQTIRAVCVLAWVLAAMTAQGAGAPADGPVVEIVTAFSPTVVPLPADQDFTGNGLITQALDKNTGPLEYAVHLNVRGAHDDNIGLTHTNRLDDNFVQIQPSLMLGIGDVVRTDTFLAAIYAPSFYRYDDHPDFDSDQHLVRVLGGIKSGNLILRLTQDVALLNNIVLAASSSERSINGRTDLDVYNTRLAANYNMTPSDFLYSELKMNRTEYAQPLVSSEMYAVNLYLNHGFSRSLVLGAGVEGGYNTVDFPTPNQSMVQANGHLRFQPSGRFALDVIAGAEFRRFESSSQMTARESYTTPVFTISTSWLPLDSTRIIFGATRQIYDSAAQTGQDYVDTNLSATIRERLCQQLYVMVVGGYEHVDYFNTIESAVPLPTLRDDYFYVQPSVDILLTRFWSLGGYYLRRENSGSVSTVGFYSNEYGVRTSIKF